MTWNYRVIRHVDKYGEVEDIWFGIHEVFYPAEDENNLEHASWTKDATSIVETSSEELLLTIQRIKNSVEKPTLMIEDNSLKEWKP